MPSTSESGKRPRARAKTKAEPKLKAVESEIDFSEFASAAEGLFVPSEENEGLVSARTWIKMPDDFSPVLHERGLPCGHISHIAGDSDTGKTTFAVQSIVNTQEQNGFVLYGLTEIKFDIDRAVDMGLDRDRVIFYKPESLEKLFEQGKEVIAKFRKKFPDKPVLWLWDSISATPSEYELDDKSTNHNMKAANAISGELRRVRSFLDKNDVHFMMINRVYQKQTKSAFEKQTTTYGGKAPKGFASIQLEFARMKTLKVKRKIEGKDETIPVGMVSKIENTKNHLAKPFHKVEVPIDKMGFVLGGRKVVT